MGKKGLVPSLTVRAQEHPSPLRRVIYGPSGRYRSISYEYDTWLDHRMLSVAWEPDGTLEVVVFRRGTWEAEVLALG